MDNSIFRKKSLERISSPESLNDCLHVTSPAVWLILTAVILLLAGMLIWSSVASIDINDMGELFALAPTGLPDGFYTVRVLFRQTLLFCFLR